jgi:hypothetical protein
VHNTAPYRVVQWTTGNVGKSSVAAIAANPTLELVGCYAWSKDKAGSDVGELAGIEPLGVEATNDVDALLALKPDVVVYNPMWIDVDELVRILEAGVNVVSSASFITGHNLDSGRDQIDEACKRGGSTMFGSGVSPGYAELLAIVAANGCSRVDKVTIAEASDTTFYDSPATEIPVGFGTPIDDPNLQPVAAKGTAVFAEAVRLGHIITAMPPIHAIPAVVAAAPGIVTYNVAAHFGERRCATRLRVDRGSAAPSEPLLRHLVTGLAVARTVPRHRERTGMPRGMDGVAHRPGQPGERSHVEHHRREQPVVDERECAAGLRIGPAECAAEPEVTKTLEQSGDR